MDYSQKFIDAFRFVCYRLEGGSAVTNPSFDGHWTKYGIIESTYQQFYPHKDVRNCTEEQAMNIYYTLFYNKARLDEVDNDSIRTFIFAGCINMGTTAFVKNCVQRPLNLVVDGIVGRNTLHALNDNPADTYRKLYDATLNRYRQLATGDRAKHLKGWTNRINLIPFKYNNE